MKINGLKGESEITNFAKDFHRVIKKFGINKIKTKLYELDTIANKNKPSVILNKIFEEITFIYGILPKTLLHSNKRGNTTQARVIAMIILNKHFTTNKRDIALIMRTDESIVNHRLKAFERMDNGEMNKYGKIFHDKNFMINLENINNNISKFVKKLNYEKQR